MRSSACLVALVFALAPLGCKDKGAGGPPDVSDQLVNVRVGGTPLEVRVPKDWDVQDLTPAAVPEKPALKPGETPKVALTGRLVFKAQAKESVAGVAGSSTAAPWMAIFHDPWLPVGTTAQDYLDAQRADNQKAVEQGTEGATTRIRHVEAERSRRQGRPSYHVRDEWLFKIKGQQVTRTVSQESLLLVEKEGEDLHGYTLVISMLKEDADKLDAIRRAIIKSVQFAKE